MQQTTTKTQRNINAAERLLEVRERIKTLQKEEKAIKTFFSEQLDLRESDNMLVNTAIMISRYHRTRESFDTKRLTSWFNENNIDAMQFKNITHYETLTIKAV